MHFYLIIGYFFIIYVFLLYKCIFSIYFNKKKEE